ncbi:uncharacterized protein LOC34619289 [Cyclospora cayetanensis]|uniref:Uncharacterized protein LOC34619289 n=1 Tax=Cyclospora cayetanensis TaxID=88456 RepID=A0A6P6RR76_9EIME|nr:uncharacterized protein LOC34619289 [Cyclospora cayetanensis]
MAYDLKLEWEGPHQFEALASRAAALGFSVVASNTYVHLPPQRGQAAPTAAAAALAKAVKEGLPFQHPLRLPSPLVPRPLTLTKAATAKTEATTAAEAPGGQTQQQHLVEWLPASTPALHSHALLHYHQHQQLPASGCGPLSDKQWEDIFPYASAARDIAQRRLAKSAAAKAPNATLCELLQLRRVTVVLGSTSAAASFSTLFPRNPPFYSAADGSPTTQSERSSACIELLAVQPTDEATWQFACSSCECDLIAVDFEGDPATSVAAKLPFTIRRKHVLQAVRRGVSFEVSLSAFLKKQQQRQHLPGPGAAGVGDRNEALANLQRLLRFVPPRQLVLSSGASEPQQLLGPAAALAVAAALGICSSRTHAMYGSAAAVLGRGAASHANGGAVTQGWPTAAADGGLVAAAARANMPPAVLEQLQAVRHLLQMQQQ